MTVMIRDITYVGEGLIPAPLDGPALRYEPLPKDDVTDIAVHHMTGWGPPPDAPVDWEIRFLQGVDEWHRSSRGLDGIGYHIVPMASGRVYIVSQLDRYGAGVGYQNDHLLHLALPGDYTSQLPAPGHLAAAVVAVRHLYGYLGRVVPTTPHLYWGGTDCPGARWPEWVPQLREEEDMPTLDEIVDALRPVIKDEAEKAVTKKGLRRRQVLEALDIFDRQEHRWDEIAKRTRGWQLVKGSASTVYLVTRGRKYHLGNLEGFTYSGYNWGDVQTIPDDKLAEILDG